MSTEKQLKNKKKKVALRDNNICELSGKLAGRFEFSHQVFSEKFYSNTIKVVRLSNEVDEIPIVVSEKIEGIDFSRDYKDVDFSVTGRVRTYRYGGEEKKKHLKVYVFGKSCQFKKEEEQDENYVYLKGFICKQPECRTTPKGRKIADVLLAINYPYGGSDYIPCIAWSENAKEIASFEVGTCIEVKARIQSRQYTKKVSDAYEVKTAYEVSFFDMKKLS